MMHHSGRMFCDLLHWETSERVSKFLLLDWAQKTRTVDFNYRSNAKFILSVLKLTSLMYTFRTFAIDFSEFSRRAAPHNSILDMLVDFRGATRDSDVTALELISPLV